MNCSDLKEQLALYATGLASPAVEAHLSGCPLCRSELAELREISSSLSSISRPVIDATAVVLLRSRIADERHSGSSNSFFRSDWIDFAMMRIMPTTVGIVASLLIGFTVLIGMLTSAENARRDFGRAASQPNSEQLLMLAANSQDPVGENVFWVSQDDYARQRRDVSSDSPSLNPNGPLIALSRTLMPSLPTDEEVVVIAEIDANGRAQIAQIIESPIDGQMLARLERAFEGRDNVAPFVPARVDSRPRSMRVVFKFHSVSVSATGQ